MKITIIGAGYVGLVTGACFADRGHEVVCIDIDDSKVAQINDGVVPFHEPGLAEVIGRTSGSRLSASTNLHDAVVASDVTVPPV